MRLLVTGGSGYLGSILLPKLKVRHQVTVLDLVEPASKGYEWIKKDVRNTSANVLVDQFDAVIHLAAVVGDAACNKDPNLAVETNYLATKALARTCENSGKQMIFASTCSVYGANGTLHKEDGDPEPFSLYGVTKLLAENDVLASGGIVLRLGTLHGDSPRLRLDLVVNHFVRKAMSGRIVVYGGKQLRPFLHVSDAADAFVEAIGTDSGIYNAAAENMTIIELAERIAKVVPCKIEVVEEILDKRSYAVDSAKIREKLGFAPKKTIEDTVEELRLALANW